MNDTPETMGDFVQALVFLLVAFIGVPIGFGWSIHAWGGSAIESMVGSFFVLVSVVIILIEAS